MSKVYYFSKLLSLPTILILAIFSFIDIHSQNSEISVIIKLINDDKFIGETWDINAQLKDKSSNSEISKDQTTFKVNQSQTIQMVLPLSNSTQDLNRYSVFVDASSTIDDIDVFGNIDSLNKDNYEITLNLTEAS